MNSIEKVFSYIRVSTGLQKDKKTYENQEKIIREYIENNHLVLIEKFSDLGFSGADVNRESFNEMITRLNEIDAIVIYDLDRLSRDICISNDLMKVLMTNKVKILEASTNTIRDFSKDQDQLLYFISSWSNANEKRKINQRQKEGIQRFKENNGRWGRSIHYGKKPNGEVMNKSEFIKKYKDLREKQISKLEIARIFHMNPITLYKRLKDLNLFPEVAINEE